MALIERLREALKTEPELAAVFEEVKRNSDVVQPAIVFTRGELSALRTGLTALRMDYSGSASEKADEEFTGGTLRRAIESSERKLAAAIEVARASSIIADAARTARTEGKTNGN
jgi:hypothetical protein